MSHGLLSPGSHIPGYGSSVKPGAYQYQGYDQNGRIIFTCSKGLPGVDLTRTEWNEAKSITSGSIEQWISDDIMRDYRKAHVHIRLPNSTELDFPWTEFKKREAVAMACVLKVALVDTWCPFVVL